MGCIDGVWGYGSAGLCVCFLSVGCSVLVPVVWGSCWVRGVLGVRYGWSVLYGGGACCCEWGKFCLMVYGPV